MTNSENALNASWIKYDLNKSPFYNAWNKGELPLSALKDYASDYGNFIAMLPMAWETLNDEHTAEEEKEHADEWRVFAQALETDFQDTNIPAVKDLLSTARELFSGKASSIGALYAFEKQQPETSVSKLDGLRKFYPSLVKGEKYFISHSNNHHEAAKLLKLMESLTPEERAVATKSCERMAKALWDALDGIYIKHGGAAESCAM